MIKLTGRIGHSSAMSVNGPNSATQSSPERDVAAAMKAAKPFSNCDEGAAATLNGFYSDDSPQNTNENNGSDILIGESKTVSNIIPLSRPKAKCVVIFLHGLGGTGEGWLDFLGVINEN
jgi:hypothetical protein